jgi:hypothetical protein
VLNYAIYHDRYERTPDGWKFSERIYEVRYEDTTPLAGSAPRSYDACGGPRGQARGGRRRRVMAADDRAIPVRRRRLG